MLKLGLIGKNIGHSLSPKIYSEILEDQFKYDLLDFKSENDIPDVRDLMEEYHGINITTPFKKHFISSVSVVNNFSAINCLAKKNGSIQGVNTDYLACVQILKELHIQQKIKKFIILGNGTMSEIISRVLCELGQSFEQLYRSKFVGDFTRLDLSGTEETTLVINTCARSYLFSGILNQKIIFWDLNYKMDNALFISAQCQSYIDGYDLLYRQAIHAAKFWELSLKTK